MEIRKIEMCIRRSPYFDNFQNLKKKNNNNCFDFVPQLVQSIHPTTCRSMFSEANACARVARSGENCELAGSLLHPHEKSRAVRKKKLCWSEGDELSVAIDKNVKNKWNWKWIQEVDADGVPFRHWGRRFDEPRVATKKLKIIN